jgi:folate-binding protein YgfZ
MISDMWLYELGDAMLMVLPRQSQATVYEKLDQFVFSEDVQLADATGAFAAIAVVGPQAAAMISRAAEIEPTILDSLREHGCARVIFDAQPAVVTRITDAGEPGFELYVHPSAAPVLHERLKQSGAARLEAAAAETLRIEEGIPLFHRDMDEDTIPLEAGIESRAISTTKGCYVGQEVIVRVMHRGHGRVARRLVGLVIDAPEAPAPGAEVSAAGKAAGSVTSATISPRLGRPIALAYVHRDLAEPGTGLEVAGAAAQVHPLPFGPATARTDSPGAG